MISRIDALIEASISTKQQLLEDRVLIASLENAVNVITEAFRRDKKIYLCGNGGSAADAQHIAAEFTGRFYKERNALAAEALHCNSSYLTAVGNDYGFENVYARMITGIGREGDVLVGLSTSGNSANILKAFEAARTNKVHTIALTGITGGAIKSLADILLNVPSSDTPRIQESHILIGHIICELVEENLSHS